MSDLELNAYGIDIGEDGTGIKKYRKYYFNGILLDISHKDILKLKRDKLVKLIFETGKKQKLKEIQHLLGIRVCEDSYEKWVVGDF